MTSSMGSDIGIALQDTDQQKTHQSSASTSITNPASPPSLWSSRLFSKSSTPSHTTSSAVVQKLPLLHPQSVVDISPQQNNTSSAVSSSTPSSTSTSSPLKNVTPITSSSVSSPLTHVILDSGAFINSPSLSHLPSSATFLTTAQVEAELLDSKSRANFTSFPFPLVTRQPSPLALQTVIGFAKLTGDFSSLSNTDMLLLSLAWQVEYETNQWKFLKKSPVLLDDKVINAVMNQQTMNGNAASITLNQSAKENETKTNPIEQDDDNDDEMLEEEEDKENEEINGGDEERDNVDERKDNSSDSLDKKEDNAEFEGEWITPENIHQQTEYKARYTLLPRTESQVACITTDYAMQNVLLQLGIRLLSLNGLSITQIRHFLKKCHSCNTLTRDMNKEFCPACGNHTLIKVTLLTKTSESGELTVKIFHGTRHLNNRGSIYSIPKPKGGRQGGGLKLAEDVMETFKLQQRRQNGRKGQSNLHKSGDESIYEKANQFGLDQVGRGKKSDVFGYGKKNPNAVQRRTNRK